MNKPMFMELIWVDSGSFEMGSDSKDAKKDEKPRHTVQIYRPSLTATSKRSISAPSLPWITSQSLARFPEIKMVCIMRLG